MDHMYKRPRWLVLASAITALGLGTGIGMVSYPLWVLPWMHEFGVTRATVMLALAIANFLMAITAPVVGAVIARFSARSAVLVGLGAMASAFLLASVSSAFWQIIACFGILAGLGLGFAGILTGQTIAVQCYPERAGSVGGLLIFGQSMGSVIAPVVLNPMLHAFGWRVTFEIIGAALIAIALPTVFLFLAPAANAAAHAAERKPHKFDTESLGEAAFWLIVVAIVPVIVAGVIIQPNIVAIGTDAGISEASAGILVASGAGGGAIGALAVGWLIDRYDARWVYTTVEIAAILAIAAMFREHSLFALAGALAIIGFACGGAMPIMGVLTLRIFGEERFPKVFGMIVPFLLLSAAGPVVGGWLRDRTGSYESTLLLTAALLLPGLWTIWRLPSKSQHAASIAAGSPASSVH